MANSDLVKTLIPEGHKIGTKVPIQPIFTKIDPKKGAEWKEKYGGRDK